MAGTRRDDALESFVMVSAEHLQKVPSRTTPPRLAAELARLNDAVRDLARPMLTPFDQPADFGAVLRRNADV
jgi:hypothetical protein